MLGNSCETTPFMQPRPWSHQPLVSLMLSFLPKLCTSFHSPHQPAGPCHGLSFGGAEVVSTVQPGTPLWAWSLESSQTPVHIHSPPCWARPISRCTMDRPRGGWLSSGDFILQQSRPRQSTLDLEPCSHCGCRLLGCYNTNGQIN